MEQGARFWLLLAGAVLVVVAVALLNGGLVAGKTSGNEAWSDLTQAKSVEERLKIAEAHPHTPAAGWAKLMSAQEEYAYGVEDLTTPGKKDTAGPRLAKALKLFQEVAGDAGKDISQAVGGLFGAARTLEARNELDEAIKQYKLVVERFPGTPEAKQSLALIKALEDPQNRMFYKELWAYKPPANPTPLPTAPLGGLGGADSLFSPPSFGQGQPSRSIFPANTAPPADLDAPPPSTAPVPALEPPKAEAPKKEEPPAGPTPKAEPPANQPTPPK